MMEPATDKKLKRSSMLAYVPVHRRNDGPDQGLRPNQQRYSIDGPGNKSSSSGQDFNGNNGGVRYSSDFTVGSSRSTQRHSQQQQQQQLRGWRKGQHNNGSSGGSVEDEDYSEDNSFPSTPAMHHRYSDYHSNNNSNHNSMASYDPKMEKLGAMLESLSHGDRHNTGSEEWDDLLRQYDRSDEEAAILARKNKRASRIMDPFTEPPAQVPVVDEPTVILDCRDFPKSFKTHHLHDIFREYENVRGGYRIKWIDDTRALIIFEHPATAKKAYIDNVANAYAKIRPYDGPTDFLSTTTAQTNRRSMTYDTKRQSVIIPKPLK